MPCDMYQSYLMEASVSPDASNVMLNPSHSYHLMSATYPTDYVVYVVETSAEIGSLEHTFLRNTARSTTFLLDANSLYLP